MSRMTSSRTSSTSNPVVGRGGSLDEQRHPIVSAKRRHDPHDLTGDAQRLATRRHYMQCLASLEQRRDHVGGWSHEVLAVVDDQEHISVTDELSHPRQRVDVGISQLERSCDRGRNRVGMAHRRELDQHDIAIVRVEASELGGKTGLAGTTGTHERDHAVCSQEAGELGQLVVAANQRSQRGAHVRSLPPRLVGNHGWGRRARPASDLG